MVKIRKFILKHSDRHSALPPQTNLRYSILSILDNIFFNFIEIKCKGFSERGQVIKQHPYTISELDKSSYKETEA